MPVTSDELVNAFLAGDVSLYEPVRHEPEIAWLAIVELSKRSLTDQQVSVLAAGPLEDLLVYHGLIFIDRIVREARVDAAFRRLLGGVWKNRIADSVWDRLVAIRGQPW